MKAKFVNESIEDILKSKDLSAKEREIWERIINKKGTLDDVYELLLNDEQKKFIDEILDGKEMLHNMYWEDGWYKMGGWNGMMGAIKRYKKIFGITEPSFEGLPEEINIWDLLMNELTKA